jgi:hypothetical protein
MNEPRNRLALDLKAVRYMQALAAGDLKVIANLWVEAGGDPELERTLTEIDGAIFEEEAGSHSRARRKRRRLWAGATGALAACLLGALFMHGRAGKEPAPGVVPAVPDVVRRPPVHLDRLAATRLARRDLDEAELPSFTWPLSQASPLRPTSMPAGQLE